MNGIMIPEHPRWEEFCDRLIGPEGCNFQQTDPQDPKTITWKCKGNDKGKNYKSFARRILEDMNVDVERSLEFFQEHGGHCDCEIVFNVIN